jgi:hypothetical protein
MVLATWIFQTRQASPEPSKEAAGTTVAPWKCSRTRDDVNAYD